MIKMLVVLAICFVLTSCGDASQKVDSLAGNILDMGVFEIPYPDGFYIKQISEQENELSGSYSVMVVFKPVPGLKQGDIDSIAPLIENICSSMHETFVVENIFINGISGIYIEAELKNSPYVGLFVPLDDGIAEVYTKTLPNENQKNEAIKIIRGLRLKQKNSLGSMIIHLLEPMSRN